VFTVSVDGKQIGGTFTALASKAAGQAQNFTLKGYFGTGNHVVAVKFLNDAYNGTYTTDRNLYVESVTYRGVNTNQSASLWDAGTKTFTVTGGTNQGSVKSPENTIVLAGSTAGITDKNGNVWTLSGGKVAVNGKVDPLTANVKKLAFVKDTIWQQNTANLWWSKSLPSDAWSPEYGTATAPINITLGSGGQTKVVDGIVVHSETAFGATISLTGTGMGKVILGSSATSMRFVSMQQVSVAAGTAASTVIADGGTHTFTAGKGQLGVTGGPGGDSYIYHAGNAMMTVNDFATAKGDKLIFDKALQGNIKMGSDGRGGTLISFGALGAGVDLKGITSVPTSAFRWV